MGIGRRRGRGGRLGRAIPRKEKRETTKADYTFVRLIFRVWPGQAAVVEQAIKPAIVQSLKALDGAYADWMVTIHHRGEPRGGGARYRLPRPAVLRDA